MSIQVEEKHLHYNNEKSFCWDTFSNICFITSQVDVIVNSANKSMKLSSGGLSQSLIDIAGEELQEEANQKYKNGIVDGDVAVTGGYGLKCREVYHGSIPSWHGKTGAVGPDQVK